MAKPSAKPRIRRAMIVYPLAVLFLALVAVFWVGCLITQPTFRSNRQSEKSVEPERLREHVVMMSETFHPRDWRNVGNLDKCAAYIAEHFAQVGGEVEEQVFEVQGSEYRNVIGRFGAGKGKRLVVGAHYDSHGITPGADDNASGVAVLLELARLLGDNPPTREIELVAYTLEEPPFFRTPFMGSAVHAQRLADEGAEVAGVIVLDMVGYFSDEAGSQSYPTPLMHLFYPGRGDFVAVVSRWDQGSWIRSVKGAMVGTTDLPVHSLRAPEWVSGVDFSDHLNYWPHGINAAMISNTGFYRNHAYHTASDTADRLDYERMAMVTVALFEVAGSKVDLP
jgi:hypothetical protein